MEYTKKRRAGSSLLNKFNRKLKDFGKRTSYSILQNDQKVFPKLQKILMEDQGSICAYCQGRISKEKNNLQVEDNLQVEHYKPRSIFNGKENPEEVQGYLCDKSIKIREDLRIEYSNLLGVCNGDSEGDEKHCDVPKGNHELCGIPNPSTSEFVNFQNQLKYSAKGSIYFNRTIDKAELINKEIEEKLNLNEPELVKRRAKLWTPVRDRISDKVGFPEYKWNTNKPAALKEISNQIVYHSNLIRNVNEYAEFRGYILYRLKTHKARLERMK